jgi:hypothetical protein
MHRYPQHRLGSPTSWLALGMTLLLIACSGCMPSKFSDRDLQDASNFVKARLEAKLRSPGSTARMLRWVRGPQAAAGSDSVSVFGDFEAVARDGTVHTYTCNTVLRRLSNGWGVMRMKVQDQTQATTAMPTPPTQ